MATTPARTAGGRWSHAWMTATSSGFSGRPWAAGCGGTAIGITPLVQHLVQPSTALVASAVLPKLRTTVRPIPKLDVESSSPFARCCSKFLPRADIGLTDPPGSSGFRKA